MFARELSSRNAFVFLSVFVQCLLLSSTAVAEEFFPERETPTYRISGPIDGAVLVGAAAVSSASLFTDEMPAPSCASEANDFLCDPRGINAFDRGAAQNESSSWRSVSDIGVPVAMVLSLGNLFVAEDASAFLSDALIGAQSVMVTTAIGAITTTAVRRPRPWAYNASIPVEDRLAGRNALSFFSGHTATAATAMTYSFTTLLRRKVHPAYAFGTLAIGAGATALVGTGRVLSGKHFPSDVLAGVAIGSAIGILVPALHELSVTLSPSVGRHHAFISAGLLL